MSIRCNTRPMIQEESHQVEVVATYCDMKWRKAGGILNGVYVSAFVQVSLESSHVAGIRTVEKALCHIDYLGSINHGFRVSSKTWDRVIRLLSTHTVLPEITSPSGCNVYVFVTQVSRSLRIARPPVFVLMRTPSQIAFR